MARISLARIRKRWKRRALEKRERKRKWRLGHQKRWGYFFTLPFFLVFLVFSCIPIVDTIRYSFYEYYTVGLMEVGPTFVGLDNYISILDAELLKYLWNTIVFWLGAFLPQLLVSLLLAAWLTDARLLIHGREFFKVVMYLPGVVMASAWSVLLFTLFADSGAVNQLLQSWGLILEPIHFFTTVAGIRFLVCMLLFLMNFGNSTLLLLASISGIPASQIESGFLDGCSYRQVFWYIILPRLRPVVGYIMITSLIAGLQLFDIPQILTNGKGNPGRVAMTLIMYLNRHLSNNNYGMSGALSVYLFLVSGVLCWIVYRLLDVDNQYYGKVPEARKIRPKRRLGGTKE